MYRFAELRFPASEAILEAYSSIGSLAKVYGAIAFILDHAEAVEAYLADRRQPA